MTERTAKSISQETTFARDVIDRTTLERTLREQATEIAHKLRRDDLMGTTVKLKIRWPDFTTPTRQLTLSQPTDEPDVIAEAALRTRLGAAARSVAAAAWSVATAARSLVSVYSESTDIPRTRRGVP